MKQLVHITPDNKQGYKPRYSVDYELTLTLLPKFYKYNQDVQLENTEGWIKRFSIECQTTCVAELTSVNNIHYHCIMRVDMNQIHEKDPKRYILDILRQYHLIFGKKSMSPVKNYNNWTQYIMKSPYKVLRDDYELFNGLPKCEVAGTAEPKAGTTKASVACEGVALRQTEGQMLPIE